MKTKHSDLLTIPRAAKILGKPKMTLYRWVKSGRIIGLELGGIIFIPMSEVKRLGNEIDGTKETD